MSERSAQYVLLEGFVVSVFSHERGHALNPATICANAQHVFYGGIVNNALKKRYARPVNLFTDGNAGIVRSSPTSM
jgi:single-stranded DNA-specific DHH superfamily exonuclease